MAGQYLGGYGVPGGGLPPPRPVGQMPGYGGATYLGGYGRPGARKPPWAFTPPGGYPPGPSLGGPGNDLYLGGYSNPNAGKPPFDPTPPGGYPPGYSGLSNKPWSIPPTPPGGYPPGPSYGGGNRYLGGYPRQ